MRSVDIVLVFQGVQTICRARLRGSVLLADVGSSAVKNILRIATENTCTMDVSRESGSSWIGLDTILQNVMKMRMIMLIEKIRNAMKKFGMKLWKLIPYIYFTTECIYVVWLGYEWCVRK